MDRITKVALVISLVIVVCVAGFFALMRYYGYKHQTDKYLQVEVANCSEAKHLTEERLEDFPTLKKALEIAESNVQVDVRKP